MDANDEYLLGEDAKQVMHNKAYRQAWEAVRGGIINAMSQSAIGDEKTHTRLVLALQIVNKVQRQLEMMMESGKMAELKLTDKKFMGLF